VQDDLGLVELLLDRCDAARLGGILVLLKVFLQLGEGHLVLFRVLLLRRSSAVRDEKLVDDLGQNGVSRQGGVVFADDDAGDTLGAGVAVENIICID
jgi:hypothetical protein